MEPIEVIGHVDRNHRLHADVPHDVPIGPVRVVLLTADEETADWMAAIAMAWHDDLADPRQDIYTLADGEPVK